VKTVMTDGGTDMQYLYAAEVLSERMKDEI
jgi:hypothetical protein